MGTLFIVATPIGNLEDISPRALRTLRDVRVIAAEDTRRTLQLLRHFQIETKLISCHALNEHARRSVLIAELDLGDIALVTDAGTPAISDPGVVIVDAVHAAGFKVISIPGASALTAALSVSGLIKGPFSFLGFPPRSAKERKALFNRVEKTGFGAVLFESPHRTAATLKTFVEIDPDRRIAVIRELTKIYEETIRGAAFELYERFEAQAPRGEVVIVIEGGAPEIIEPDTAEQMVFDLIDGGMRASDAAKEVAAQTGLIRSELYRSALDRKTTQTGTPVSDDA